MRSEHDQSAFASSSRREIVGQRYDMFGSQGGCCARATYGPDPFAPFPCSAACFLFLNAISRSFRAALVAARLVSILVARYSKSCTDDQMKSNACRRKQHSDSLAGEYRGKPDDIYEITQNIMFLLPLCFVPCTRSRSAICKRQKASRRLQQPPEQGSSRESDSWGLPRKLLRPNQPVYEGSPTRSRRISFTMLN